MKCKATKLPFKYSGLLVGAISRREGTWEPRVKLFTKRISSWKNMFMSFWGKFVLLKMHVYVLKKLARGESRGVQKFD